MKPVFNNTHNKVYQTDDGDKWHSRACAVVAHVWIKYVKLDKSNEYFILVGKRGIGGDNIGKLNIPCGYMDWDENLTQATRRELYEETGFDIQDYLSASLRTSIKQPWYVKTDPDENRQNISMHTGILLELEEGNFELPTLSKKYILLIFLVPTLIAIGVFQTFEHNFIKFTEVKDWSPLLFAIIASILLILPLKLKHYLILFSILSLMVSLSIVDTRKIQPEEEIVKKAAKWYNDQIKQSKNPQNTNPILFTEDSRIAVEHALFYFYSEKNKADFKNKPVGLTKETTDKLKKGDLVIWESHYGFRPELRPTSQNYEYYEKDSRFQKIQYYQSSDNRFTIVFFLKTSDN